MIAPARIYGASVAALPRAQKAMLGVLLVAVAAATIEQPYPDLAPLQHIPTVVLALAAPLLLRRWPLSTASVASLCLFMALHTLGGRYIYSYVPYDDWARMLTGHGLSDAMGWRRNHYDRLIHFAFGLLWTLPLREASRGTGGEGGLFTAFAVIGLVSALYEVFEWALTMVAAGDTADYYNGQQGDLWDAQKDMALALLGSVAAIIWTTGRQSWRQRK